MYEFFTLGGGAYLVDLLNAVAAITSGGAFITLGQLAGVAGLAWVLFRTAFGGSWKDNAKWILLFAVVWYALGRLIDHPAIRWRHDETFYSDPGETMMALRPDGQLTHVMYYEGAHMLARDLGFMNAPALKGWAERHPEIWSTRHGERMFAGYGSVAFGKPPFTPVMVSEIVAWWDAVADRLDAAIPVHADQVAALAALKCHDLPAQESIAVEPCMGGYRLVRQPRPVSLPSLQP